MNQEMLEAIAVGAKMQSQQNHTQLASIAINISSFPIIAPEVDDTGRLERALEYVSTNHGILLVPTDTTLTVDSITLTDKTNFKILVEGTLKRRASGTSTGMIILLNCHDVDIWLNADGNVANNGVTINEHQHILAIGGGSTNIRLHRVLGKNPAGDIIYLNDCDDVYGGYILGYGENTGRNTLSVAKGKNMQFSNILSIGVGTEGMPSGVDLEPNLATDTIKNIQFGNVYIDSIGTGAFSLSNIAGADCSDVIANNVIIKKRTRLSAGYLRCGFSAFNFDNVKIKGTVTEDQADTTKLTSLGLWVVGGKNVEIDVIGTNLNKGANLGFTSNTDNLKLTGTFRDIYADGFELGLLSNSKINVRMENCNMAQGANFNLRWSSGAALSNVKFYGSYDRGNNNNKCGYITGTNSDIAFDCDFNGWTDDKLFTNLNIITGLKMRRIIWNAPTLQNNWVNYGGAMPTVGYTKDINGMVHLKGMIKDGTVTSGTTLFNLPVGYRPSAQSYYAIVSSGAFGSVFVATDGNVKIETANTTYISLNGLSFQVT